MRTLAAGEKQKLEILKQLYLGSSIVILDEPTSVLTPDEADEVLGLLREMALARRADVLMITHKFREVTKFADEVTVLRRGRAGGRRQGGRAHARGDGAHDGRRGAADAPTSSATTARRGDVGAGDPRPACRRRSGHARGGRPVTCACTPARSSASPACRATARRSWSRCWPASASRAPATVRGQRQPLPRAPRRDARARGALPARRAAAQRLRRRDVGRREHRLPPLRPRAVRDAARTLVSQRALRKNARALIAEYGIRAPGPDAPIGSLSGGNVQRAVLARELRDDVSLLIAAQPLLRPGLRGRRRDPLAPHRRAQPRRRRAADQRRPRRDLRAVRSDRGDERRARRARGRRSPTPTSASSAATWPGMNDDRRCRFGDIGRRGRSSTGDPRSGRARAARRLRLSNPTCPASRFIASTATTKAAPARILLRYQPGARVAAARARRL